MTTVAVMKTKAEQALAEQFDKTVGALPGGSKVRNFRREAIAEFAQLGPPHRRIEEWKYTDVRAQMRDSFASADGGTFGSQAISETLSGDGHGLLPGLDTHTVIFVDGAFVSSTLPKTLAGVETLSLSDALTSLPSWVSDALAETVAPADGVVALNTAYMSGGFAIRVADGVDVEKPIHLVFTQSGDTPKSVTTRCIVTTGRDAKLTVIETHVTSRQAPRQQNTLMQLSIGDASEVQHIKNLTIDAGSIHLANSFVRLGKNAHYKPFQMTTGAGFTRANLNVTFEGQHAMLDLGGVALGDHDGHADLTMVIDHAVPNCTSRELYKAVLEWHVEGRVPRQGDRAARRAEDRRQANGAGPVAVAGR